MRLIIVGGIVATTLLAGMPAQAAGSLDPLLGSVAERLVLSDQVAAAKWGTDQPIDDPPREQQVLDEVSAKAQQIGLDPQQARRVFRDQIEASKLIQRGLYAYWSSHPDQQPTQRPDLSAIRPQLDRVGDDILRELRDTTALREHASCEGQLAASYAHTAKDLDPLHDVGLARAIPSVCVRS